VGNLIASISHTAITCQRRPTENFAENDIDPDYLANLVENGDES